MQKIHTEQIVHYDNADRRNRQPVYVVICVTEADGSLYTGFGPNDAELFTNLFYPAGIVEHVEIDQFVTQGTNGYHGLWLIPGKTDVWHKGIYILGYRLRNATHQCAGMIRLRF